ncbi:MAG: sugar transferase [Gammaproteobacteria bacterium]|nr:sugar transferase [Gammaproteobacteria bacterium]
MKRFFDVTLSLFLLLILSPLIAMLYGILKIKMGGSAIFQQERPGFCEKVFKIYKFQTMTNEKDKQGQLLPDEKRLTALGVFLRKTSLDELPQLWNILQGEMSFVGPRPLIGEYLSLFNAEQKRRYLVRPGITGWAQVNGRNTISWEQKFKYDLWYVDHQSFWLDIRIMMLTVKKVLFKEDISSFTNATMEKFEGNLG